MTDLEDTYPLVRQRGFGYGNASAVTKAEKNKNLEMWKKLGKLEESRKKAITGTRAHVTSNSETLLTSQFEYSRL